MSIDRRIPLSVTVYRAAKDRAGDVPLAEYINSVLIQVLQPVALPVSIPAAIRNSPSVNESVNLPSPSTQLTTDA